MLTSLVTLTAACDDQAQAPGFLRGYTHALERSRFDLGDFVSEMDDLGMHKVVGSRGTFSTELVSRAVVALPDVPFPDPATGVYPGDSDAQNAAVLSYFTEAGVPANQVASVSADGTGLVHGQYVLSGWYSILHRDYDGVPIDDSTAFAALNASGKSASEQVYWPEIPGDVLEQVRVFREMLADPSQRAAYVQKLPAISRDAILVIHHTSWFWQGPFQAQACCRGAERTDICLDISGHVVDLPDEPAAGSGAGDGDGGPQLVCPVSASGLFEDTPSGTCVGVGSCAVELDNSCRPGLTLVPDLPPVFECRCISNQWNCVPRSGALGLRSCDDAG